MKMKDCESAKKPLRLDSLIDDGIRPRDWQPRRVQCKVPLRLVRLCLLGVLLPAILVAAPIYLRYRVFSEQLYPLAVSDQRLIDGRISTTWCQRQVVKANATFNAYLISGAPKMQGKVTPISMTRHLVLEDDMKEYWGFYLLRGSSVTVSTCVRWPGASLAVIRGHKNLHECAFIGDDSSEELEELIEVAAEQGIIGKFNSTSSMAMDGPSNEPSKMKRAHQDVEFHHQSHRNTSSGVNPSMHHQYTSHELDAKDMRAILTQLFSKTLDMRKRQNSTHHHYEGTFKESANIDKPPTLFDDTEFMKQELLRFNNQRDESSKMEEKTSRPSTKTSTTAASTAGSTNKELVEAILTSSTDTPLGGTTEATSVEMKEFQDALQKLKNLGEKGKKYLNKLVQEANHVDSETKKIVNDVISEAADRMQRRRKRELFLSSPMGVKLSKDDEDDDAAVEEGMLHPDGIAEDHVTVDEHTLNDRSNSEFWSSFSSSEERLLQCKGLILNLPLTPHRYCEPKLDHRHPIASTANTITYRVPTDGYYFFVFSSENEIQPNFLRVKFDLLKTMYNTSESVYECKNSTTECSLPISFFSGERTVLELPVGNNDSQWNNEYVITSTCEPRTSIYIICTMAVPLLILMCAFY